MGQRCTVCDHPERLAIVAALEGGASINATAERFGVPATNLRRHLHEHERPAEADRAGPGRPCSSCTHPQRAEIDRFLMVEGGLSRAARQVENCPDRRSLRRHRDHCLADLFQERRAEIAEGLASSARERAEALYRTASQLLAHAHRLVREAKRAEEDTVARAKTMQAAAALVGKASTVVELLARLTGELRPAVNVQVILNTPEFARIQETLIRALAPFGPEPLAAVGAALRELDGPGARPQLVEAPQGQ